MMLNAGKIGLFKTFWTLRAPGLKIQHSALSKVSQKHHRGGNSQRFYTAESSTNNEANSSVIANESQQWIDSYLSNSR
jgi:hypothetical protein